MEAGSQEGSVYGSAQIRNIFGGAESVNLYASRGSRTRSIYSAWFDTPILSNPDLRWEFGGHSSATLKPWASHEEVLKAGSTKLKYLTPSGHSHELQYSGAWRQITGLTSTASPSVRLEAGDSFKSSLTHTWINDRRDNPLLPSSGWFVKTISELAGLGPLKGDVGFCKTEIESQAAIPIPLPAPSSSTSAFTTAYGVSLNASFRAGLLYPLNTASGLNASRLSDRFQLGGPQDVRGYRQSGLGPHDGHDAIGGDVYAAGGLSLLTPLPRTGVDTPLRLQLFVNAGRLLALKGLGGKSGEQQLTKDTVKESVRKTVEELKSGLPSATAGIGLVYAHPLARFEINFSVPVVMKRDELARKGVQFGVGVTFL
jgi:outer membrane protein insertion porin family